MRRPIGKMLNLRSRSGDQRVGTAKTNETEVKVLKQRIKDGMSIDEAREGLRISKQSAKDIASGRSWSWVVLVVCLVVALLGNKCPTNDQSANDRRACWDYDYPLCSDVPSTYPCLCVQGRSSAVTSESDERELYNPVPTPDYQYEGSATDGGV